MAMRNRVVQKSFEFSLRDGRFVTAEAGCVLVPSDDWSDHEITDLKLSGMVYKSYSEADGEPLSENLIGDEWSVLQQKARDILIDAGSPA